MSSNQKLRNQLGVIALVALVAAIPLVFERTFAHASILDPTLTCDSCYVEGFGFFMPWFITPLPAGFKHVSLIDRFFPSELLRLYTISFVAVAVLWVFLRSLAAVGRAIVSRSEALRRGVQS